MQQTLINTTNTVVDLGIKACWLSSPARRECAQAQLRFHCKLVVEQQVGSEGSAQDLCPASSSTGGGGVRLSVGPLAADTLFDVQDGAPLPSELEHSDLIAHPPSVTTRTDVCSFNLTGGCERQTTGLRRRLD